MATLYGEQLVTPATAEPLGLDETKQHLRVTDHLQDATIQALIAAARVYAETVTKRQFVTATWLFTFDMFPRLYPLFGGTYVDEPNYNVAHWATLYLPRPTCQSVTQIQYTDPNGNLQTWASDQWTLDTVNEPARITPVYGVPWPLTRYIINAVQITAVCGYGTPAQVPQQVKQAMLLMIGHWWVNRESVNIGNITSEIPQTSELLLRGAMWGSYV